MLCAKDSDILRQVEAESAEESFRGEGSLSLKAYSLCQCVDAGIGARAGAEVDLLPGHPVQDFIEFIGNRTVQPVLFRALPAQIPAAVILDVKSDILHFELLPAVYFSQ